MTVAPVSVLNDPSPTVDRIDGLARRILIGDILLPKFQRAFVWKRPAVISLLDSIARGYPIGSILLWRTKQELRSEKMIADLDVAQQPKEYPFNYLLDGQQRLSTICGSLFWNGKEAKSIWNIAYDLRTRRFFHTDTLDDIRIHQIRVNKLSNPSVYFSHIAQLDMLAAPDKEELKSHAKEIFDRFTDYKIAVVTLADMSIEAVAPIFERINSQGVALTRVELLRAATWSSDFDLSDALDNIRDGLEEKGFKDLDPKTVMRNVSASQGGGFSIDQIELLRQSTPDRRLQAAKDTKEAYRRAVDFLSDEIGVASAAGLPYANQIVVLAEAFRLLPNAPPPHVFAAIRSWFWRTSLGSHFGGWNTGQMAADLKSVRAFAESRGTELKVDAARHDETIWFLKTFRANTALSKAFAILLATQGPRDILTGRAIDTRAALSWANQKEFHHFFPQKFLKSIKTSNEVHALANIVFLSSASNKDVSSNPPSKYLRVSMERLGDEFTAVMRSNLISESAVQAALNDDYDSFLIARASALEAVAGALAQWPTNAPYEPISDADDDAPEDS